MSKDITVQIRVENYNEFYYLQPNEMALINKKYCTVVPSVEETEGEPKGYCIKRTPENADVLNKWVNEQDYAKWQCPSKGNSGWCFSVPPTPSGCLNQSYCKFKGFTELFTVEDFFEKVGYKPEPQRKSIGMYEGVEIYEDTKAWFIDLGSFRIIERILPISTCINYSEDNGIYYSRFYLTPKEANARLKEEILKKAKKKTFTFAELEGFDKYDHTPIGYAIQLIEKEFNVIYLQE